MQDVDQAPGSCPVGPGDGQDLAKEALAAARAGQAAGANRPAGMLPSQPISVITTLTMASMPAPARQPTSFCSGMSAARRSRMPVTHCELWL